VLAGCVGLIPAPELTDVLARAWNLIASGDEASVREGECLHAGILPLLTYLMANPEHMLCYGRQVFATRAGIADVHPRHPCVSAHPFGLQMVERLSAGIAPLPAAQ
jgi:4-hydroxy-tetrahydrodipicolinate synthase